MFVPQSSRETRVIFFMRNFISTSGSTKRKQKNNSHVLWPDRTVVYPSKLKKEHLEIIPAIRLDCLPSLHRPTFVRGQFRRLSQAHPPPLPTLHSIASSGLQLSSDGLPHLFVLKSSPTIMRTSNFSTKG